MAMMMLMSMKTMKTTNIFHCSQISSRQMVEEDLHRSTQMNVQCVDWVRWEINSDENYKILSPSLWNYSIYWTLPSTVIFYGMRAILICDDGRREDVTSIAKTFKVQWLIRIGIFWCIFQWKSVGINEKNVSSLSWVSAVVEFMDQEQWPVFYLISFIYSAPHFSLLMEKESEAVITKKKLLKDSFRLHTISVQKTRFSSLKNLSHRPTEKKSLNFDRSSRSLCGHVSDFMQFAFEWDLKKIFS